ncbi:RnfABCDGE type electron transport complex subunit G [Parabacteroides sp. PF5-9]|uniref:RnfABCDGE type electron transport complex subunit G n=1 Tax=Parabacteroides sp. PF5-9 TaxID=1742404 RepID=UPI00247644A6|nr:RnfABCDGE type electron transport complex subunit G [Parabacteroides sp. PF5-9]MDH6356158.1 electron transport complex protein RnfG [Parabacteroides sp. PF5-9]
MGKLKSTLPNMLLSLTIICLSAGAILAGVNKLTTEPIALSKAAALENAIREVTPSYDNNPLEEAYKAVTSEGDSLLIYPATKEGQPVGVAVESYTMNGFSGEIRIIVGFDQAGAIVNYSVLQHAETPGLGSKMQEWFRTDKNNQNIIGRSLANGNLSVSKDGGDVDAITASTITSRAFLQAVNSAYSAYKGTDGSTGATTNAEEVDSVTEATPEANQADSTKTEEGGAENE